MLSSDEMRGRLIQKFWAETNRNLRALRTKLTDLQQPNNHETIQAMFLAAHTIKGNLGMMQLLELDLLELNSPASDLEGLLLSLRDQEISFNGSVEQTLENYLVQLENQLASYQGLLEK